MKKYIKALSFFVVLTLLFVNSLNIIAIDREYPNKIEISDTEYTTISRQNNVTSYFMNTFNLKKLRNVLNENGLSEKTQNIKILKQIGFHEKTINGMSDSEIDAILQNAISIRTDIAYLKVNDDGVSVIVSEEECMNAVQQYNNYVSTSSNDNWENWTDGEYMRMTISCVYLEPSASSDEKGWYNFHTWYEWLTMPNNRLVDAMSIAAPICIWPAKNSAGADYYSSMYYQVIDANGNSLIFNAPIKTDTDLSVESGGFYYTWDLPNNDTDLKVNYIQIYMRGKARDPKEDNPHMLTVHVKYVHTKKVLSSTPVFAWTTTDKFGVYLNKTTMNKTNYYFESSFIYTP